ncbi:DUF1427 family protein [Streptomyces sp. DH24]|uniref:DUF1427 family protein n=1 Tax=Streptomyces sp. DH24 TaxID=3040123 RepID=UPI002442689A|nr:DUF1427 family protein [Streptomyces sp. DH24]MDG9719030.1 DUF1427 family protein [Streptomyces sp. DH24]
MRFPDPARAAAVSFAAGLLMGVLYWTLDVPSPAPPLVGLAGLLGIVIGERVGTRGRDRLAAARTSGKDPSRDLPDS